MVVLSLHAGCSVVDNVHTSHVVSPCVCDERAKHMCNARPAWGAAGGGGAPGGWMPPTRARDDAVEMWMCAPLPRPTHSERHLVHLEHLVSYIL